MLADLFDPAGENDSFINVTPGTTVSFAVNVSNDGCVEPTTDPQHFSAFIRIIGDGVAELDYLEVTIVIPPVDLSGPKD